MNKPFEQERVLSLLAGENRQHMVGVAAGTVATHPDLIIRCDLQMPELGFICSKSIQVKVNPGNPGPILVEPRPGCFGNAVGLRNPGLRQSLADFRALRERYRMRSLLIISLAGSSKEDFVQLAQALGPFADALELNFSCPHSEGHGTAIGCDPQLVKNYLQTVRQVTARPLIAKLSANCTSVDGGIGTIAGAAVAGGADAITAVNTVGPACYTETISGAVLLQSQDGRGGQSGQWIHRQALRAVREVRAAVNVPIVGCGGVDSPEAVQEMVAAGATAVAVGSAFARVSSGHWPDFCRWLVTGTGLRSFEPPVRYVPAELIAYRSGLFHHGLGLHMEGPLPEQAGGLAFLWDAKSGERAVPFACVDQGQDKDVDLWCWLSKKEEHSFILEEGEQFFFRHRAVTPNWQPVGNVLLLGWQYSSPWLLAWLFGQSGWEEGRGGVTETEEAFTFVRNASGNMFMLTDPQSAADLAGMVPAAVEVQACTQPEALFHDVEEGDYSSFVLAASPAIIRKVVCLLEEKGVDRARVFCLPPRQFLCGVGVCGSCQVGGHLFCVDGLAARVSACCRG